jgi:type IV pilus assembly protein PilV
MFMTVSGSRARARGFTLIEILVTIVILVFGLLGIVGLQAKATNVEMESYQRGQGLALLHDMEARIAASRSIVEVGFLDGTVSSVDGSVYVGSGAGATNFVDGAGDCVPPPAPPWSNAQKLVAAQYEACQWAQMLLGTAAQEGASNVGAMIGARGCLIRMVPPENNAIADIYVVVVWQGITKGSEAPADLANPSPVQMCASGDDFGDGLRRGMALRVLVPHLTKTF